MGRDAEATIWAGIKVNEDFLIENEAQFSDCLSLMEGEYLEAIWKDEDVSLFRKNFGFTPSLIYAADEIIGFGTVILKADWDEPEAVDPFTICTRCLRSLSTVRNYLHYVGIKEPANVYLSADYS